MPQEPRTENEHVPGRDAGAFGTGTGFPLAAGNGASDEISSFYSQQDPPTEAKKLTFAAIFRFKWTFFTVFMLIAVPGTIAAWILNEPEYLATAAVQVSARGPILYKTYSPPRGYFQQHLTSQVEVLRSGIILTRVLAHQDVRSTRWFKEPGRVLFGNPPTDLERLSEAVDVSIRSNSFLIDITVAAGDPKDAATLANVIHDEYLTYVSQESSEDSQFIFETLTPEERRLRDNIVDLTRRSAEKLLEVRVISPEHLVTSRGARLEEMQTDLTDLEREIAVLERQRKQIGQAGDSPDTGEAEPSDTVRYASDVEWRHRKDNVEAAKARLEDAKRRFGPEHPEMETVGSQVGHSERRLREWESYLQERRTLRALQLEPIGTANEDAALDADTLSRTIAQKKYSAQLLRKDIEDADDRFKRDFENALQLTRESDALRYDKEKHALIRRRLDEMRIEGAVASIRSAGKAVPPSRSSHWKRPFLYTGMAFFAGLFAGFVIVNWRGVKTPAARDFSRLSGTPLLGLLPHIRPGRHSTQHDRSIQTESIRVVRTAVLHRLQAERGGAILITSAGPGAGKTTMAIMFAKSLADVGKKVLLVDADLRHPNVAKSLGIDAETGLSQLLTAQTTDAEAIVEDDTLGLSVLPSALGANGRDVELLANGVFTTCLDRWRKRYDFIVLDCCPVIPVADAPILFPHVDGIILVAREGRCRQADLVEALTSVHSAGGRLLGTVFVASPGGRSYGYRNSGYSDMMEEGLE